MLTPEQIRAFYNSWEEPELYGSWFGLWRKQYKFQITARAFKFESVVKGFRDPSWGTPDYGESFEYLAEEMIRIRKKKGLPVAFSYLLHPTSELHEEHNR